MKIGILGATSQIAKDLIVSFSNEKDKQLHLFARRPDDVTKWLNDVGLSVRYLVDDFGAFGTQEFDAIINFVGIGNPARASAMGASIFDVTIQYDELALSYVKQHPACRYIFLSSGAAYGSNFSSPVEMNTKALIDINNLQPQDWYAVAKLHAECRHRALAPLPIIDIRIFNYFSRTQDIEARFFMTDIARAIRDKTVLKTSTDYIVRDFIGPEDFYQLVSVLLSAPSTNAVVDCYSKAPIDKPSQLAAMQLHFGLQYELVKTPAGVNATGSKPHYYSLNKRAEDFGYTPKHSSLDTVFYQMPKAPKYQLESSQIIYDDLEYISSTNLPWESLRNKKILVTGGGGFLAAYLIKSLLTIGRKHKLNLKVICVARNTLSVASRLSTYLGSLDLSVVLHDISKPLPNNFPRADFIIHAASQASPKYYGVDPVGTLLANSVGTMYLLDHAVKSQAERFLFFSSGEVYGIPLNPNQLVGEQDYGYLDPMNLRSCYAESKRVGETMCVAWAQQHGLYASVVRPFHTYGPGMAIDDGRVFADFVADVVAKRDIVLKSDGLAQRPFCYIADATIGFLTVLLRGDKAEAYNVANPDAEISIRDLAVLVANLFPERNVGVKFEVPVSNNAYLKSPISRSCPSIEKIKALDWKPTVSLQDGFRRTIQSYFYN
jgi:nucleoside-diphosphate-sugar epimerase